MVLLESSIFRYRSTSNLPWGYEYRFIVFILICDPYILLECGCNESPDACPIGDCECDGQLRVSQDCKTARYLKKLRLTNNFIGKILQFNT